MSYVKTLNGRTYEELQRARFFFPIQLVGIALSILVILGVIYRWL